MFFGFFRCLYLYVFVRMFVWMYKYICLKLIELNFKVMLLFINNINNYQKEFFQFILNVLRLYMKMSCVIRYEFISKYVFDVIFLVLGKKNNMVIWFLIQKLDQIVFYGLNFLEDNILFIFLDNNYSRNFFFEGELEVYEI